MKKIPSFQNFERNLDLNQKISPQLAESLAEWFSEDPNLNEAKGFDVIKNFLSKTFLGSLSYLNMIDKLRSEILKLQKEMVSKEYEYQDQIEALKKEIKNLPAESDESSVESLRKKLDLKSKEYTSYKKMTDTRIDKAVEKLNEIIKGNKRRTEYYQAGKSQDEVELAEFEYALAKKRASAAGSDPDLSKSLSDDLKKREEELKKLREEAERKAQEMADAQKQEAEAQGGAKGEGGSGIKTLSEGTPDFNTSFKSAKGTRDLIVYLQTEEVKLKDSLHDVKKETQRRAIENQIKKIKDDLKLANEVLKKHLAKKLETTQKKHAEKEALQKKAADQVAKNDQERQDVLSKIEPEEKGKPGDKTKDVKSQEKQAKTTSKINQTAKDTFKKIVK